MAQRFIPPTDLCRDFRVLVLLPYATNTDWRGEDGVTARNTWSVPL